MIESKEQVPWLAATTDEVEHQRGQLLSWLVERMNPSSLNGIPQDIPDTPGAWALRQKYMMHYLEHRLELDPDVVVEAQGIYTNSYRTYLLLIVLMKILTNRWRPRVCMSLSD